MERIEASSYYGEVWRKDGAQLLGRPTVKSSRFSHWSDAQRWVDAWSDNLEVEGDVRRGYKRPEIIRCDCGSLMVVTQRCPECNKVEV